MNNSLLHIWTRLANRDRVPRRWWWPLRPQRMQLDLNQWLRQHDQVSKTLNKTMFVLIGYAFFCILTLAAPDASLLTIGATISVPFAGTKVDYVSFLIIGPVILIGLTFYLHIYLHEWLLLGTHEEGTQLPFVFNICNPVAGLLSYFCFYWLPVFLLASFARKALPRPDEKYWLILMTLGVTIWLVGLQIRRCPDNRRRWLNPPLWLLIGFLVMITEWHIASLHPAIRGLEIRREFQLYGAKLSGQNLQRAFLMGADLRNADLSGTDLRRATLSEADLSDADLQKADLRGAHMSLVPLIQATLRKLFPSAGLGDSELEKAYRSEANLTRANLRGADLRGVNGLRCAALVKAYGWEAAYRDSELACGAAIPLHGGPTK